MKVGVIGSGAISDIYLKNMIHRFDNLEVVAVASQHIEHAKIKAEKYGIAYCTVDELLDNPEVEMIVNLTPVGAHYELIKRALLAGKHVYTEKTMTDRVETAKELVELANEKNLYLGSAPDTFLGAAVQTARQAIDQGLLGEIQSFVISANRDNDILLSWFSFLRQPGAGSLYDYAVYYMTVLTSILGSVSRVAGVVRAPYKDHMNIFDTNPEYGQSFVAPNESQVSAILQMKSGVTGTFHINSDTILEDQAYFAIYGTKGILYLTDPNQFGGKVTFKPKSFLKTLSPQKTVELYNYSTYTDNSRGIGPSEMATAIKQGVPNRASKEMAYHVEEVLTGIFKADETGAFVEMTSEMNRPEPMEPARVNVSNIGHITYQLKHEKEMMEFYTKVLGMKELFSLHVSDLREIILQKDGSEEEKAKAVAALPNGDNTWITYLKFADRQFLELFHDIRGSVEDNINRHDIYGYFKCNYEVDSVEELFAKIAKTDTEIVEGIHTTIDGSLEFTVLDPDGNEVQFTEYTENSIIKHAEDSREFLCDLKYRTQVAYQVQDAANMRRFYCNGLGLKLVKTLTFEDLYNAMLAHHDATEKDMIALRILGDQPWIDYIEVAPHQYIELFYSPSEEKKELHKIDHICGYQHLCLETPNIYEAWEACKANGLTMDTEISLGPDGAYQFWLHDPDGNSMEFMEYTKTAKQLS